MKKRSPTNERRCAEPECRGKMRMRADTTPPLGRSTKGEPIVFEYEEYWECRNCGYVERA